MQEEFYIVILNLITFYLHLKVTSKFVILVLANLQKLVKEWKNSAVLQPILPLKYLRAKDMKGSRVMSGVLVLFYMRCFTVQYLLKQATWLSSRDKSVKDRQLLKMRSQARVSIFYKVSSKKIHNRDFLLLRYSDILGCKIFLSQVRFLYI